MTCRPACVSGMSWRVAGETKGLPFLEQAFDGRTGVPNPAGAGSSTVLAPVLFHSESGMPWQEVRKTKGLPISSKPCIDALASQKGDV